MTLPKLHHNVTLRSYDHIRNVHGHPEACGAASPFSMGLNGLLTRNVAPLVRTFRLWGEWKEHDLEEHARFGRVPDNTMMLNIVARAAVDKMEKLIDFRQALLPTLPTEWMCRSEVGLTNVLGPGGSSIPRRWIRSIKAWLYDQPSNR